MAKPSDIELKILRYLWQAPRLSAREVHDASVAQTEWSFSTTRTVLDRMAEKGLLLIEPIHGVKTYAAAEPKLLTLARLIKNFALNVLDSDQPMPVAMFAHSKLISHDEIAALEALIEKLDGEESSK